MKKVTLIIATMLIGLVSATAAEMSSANDGKDLRITKRYRYTQPIMFVERGVEFLIFPNGDFDFNTEIVDGPFNDENYFRQNNSRRSSVNVTLSAPGKRIRYSRPQGVLILHDRYGKVRRIGNVFINYDSRGRVKRVGSVYMKYRHGRLKQVGGLTIRYNRWGDMIGLHGFVKPHAQLCGLCNVHGCTMDHFGQGHNDDWYDDDYGDFDDDFYYYKKNGKKKKRKKRKKFKFDD
ncbi:MAG: hypothetical protein KJP20_00105 [Bacteroidia bacterium]|nr:hypothetical protein [Bacteroidia bacterium]NNK60183.1 hypothetical protein [Flavobacteriaceae bacterium]